MITIETFFVLAGVVVLIGLIVWRRDVKAGRVMRTTLRGPVTVMRDRFAGRSAASGAAATPVASAPAPKTAPTQTLAESGDDSTPGPRDA